MFVSFHSSRPRPVRSEAGFTIIEVMVAMLVLMVGVLGTVSLIDGANARTTSTKEREAGTNLARELVETARGVPYAELTPALLQARLQAKPGLADVDAGSPWRIDRRGFRYTVDEASVCTIDEPGDGTAATSTAAGYCTNGGASTFPDSDPDDLKRVTVRVSSTRAGSTNRVRQSTLIHPGKMGPKVTNFVEVPPRGAGGNLVYFQADYTGGPASLEWHVEGVAKGACAYPCASPWTKSTSPQGLVWDTSGVPDGTYVVNMQAYDRSGRSAGARAVTVRLNRTPPAAPTLIGGGWNNVAGVPFGTGTYPAHFVEMEWAANPEPDVVQYRVYRQDGTLACSVNAGSPPECRDMTPGGTIPRATTYSLYAYDKADDGSLRAGPATPVVLVWPNTRPNPPTNLSVIRTGTTTTVFFTKAKGKVDPDRDDILFYRIYRDGSLITQRVSKEIDFNYVDESNGGTTHTYRITGVDENFAESSFAQVTG